MADIRYIITVDDKGTPTIKHFTGEVEKLGTTTSKQATPALAGLWKQFALGQIVVNAATHLLRSAKEALVGSITSAIEAEKSQAGLASALDTTGRNVKALLPGLVGFSRELQSSTVYTDESVQSVQTLLVQLTNLDRNGLDAATKGALGMATVFKVDVDTAARAVAKAMGGNYDMLARYIPKLKDVKDESEKHAIVMETMTQWYGRAIAETDTFGGSLAQLKNSWDEVKETVGGAVIQNESLQEAMRKVKEWVDKLAQSDDFKLWLSIVIDGLMKAAELAGKLAGALRSVGDALAGLKGKNREFEESQRKLNESLERAREAGHELGNKVLPVVAKQVEETGHKVSETGKQIEKISRTITETAIPAARNWALEIRETVVETAIPAYRDLGDLFPEIAEEADTATSEISNYFDGLYNDLARGWADTISGFVQGTITLENVFNDLWQTLKDSFFRVIGEMTADWVIGKFKSLFESIGSAASKGVDKVTESLGGAAGGVAGGVASGLLGTISSIANIVTAVASVASLFKGPEKSTDVTFWLKLLYEDLGSKIMQKFDGLKESVDLSRDSLNPMVGRAVDLLGQIRDYTSSLKGIVFAQHGLDMTVRRPTLIVAGERAPERVRVTPQRGGGDESAYLHADIYIGGDKVESKIVKMVRRAGQLGRLTFPEKVIP